MPLSIKDNRWILPAIVSAVLVFGFVWFVIFGQFRHQSFVELNLYQEGNKPVPFSILYKSNGDPALAKNHAVEVIPPATGRFVDVSVAIPSGSIKSLAFSFGDAEAKVIIRAATLHSSDFRIYNMFADLSNYRNAEGAAPAFDGSVYTFPEGQLFVQNDLGGSLVLVVAVVLFFFILFLFSLSVFIQKGLRPVSAFFLILLVLPVILVGKSQPVNENRGLTPMPQVFTPNGVDTKFFMNFNTYIRDHIGLRNEFMTLGTKVPAGLLSSTLTSTVHIGKNGWLFWMDAKYLSDPARQSRFTNSEKAEISRSLGILKDSFQKENIPFELTILPQKFEVYPEYLPDYLLQKEGVSRTEDLVQSLKVLRPDIHVYFIKQDMLKAKTAGAERMFLLQDTHWNMEGAKYASEPILDQMRLYLPAIPKPDFHNYWPESYLTPSDCVIIGHLQYPAEYSTHWYQKEVRSTLSAPLGGGQVEYSQSKSKDGYRIAIYHDSFTINLEPIVSPLFSTVRYKWSTPTRDDIESVIAWKPDLVVWLAVDAGIESIIGKF